VLCWCRYFPSFLIRGFLPAAGVSGVWHTDREGCLHVPDSSDDTFVFLQSGRCSYPQVLLPCLRQSGTHSSQGKSQQPINGFSLVKMEMRVGFVMV
jgi:hypothetical protein